MNSDTKELIESGILAVLVIAFGLGTFFLAKWNASIAVLTIFSGLAGAAMGALGMKMKAGGNGTSPKVP